MERMVLPVGPKPKEEVEGYVASDGEGEGDEDGDARIGEAPNGR